MVMIREGDIHYLNCQTDLKNCIYTAAPVHYEAGAVITTMKIAKMERKCYVVR